MFLHISALKEAGLQDAPEGSTIHCHVGQGRKGIQVLRVITLDTSTATPRATTRRPFGGGWWRSAPRSRLASRRTLILSRLESAFAVDDGGCCLFVPQFHRAWRMGGEPANIAADFA